VENRPAIYYAALENNYQMCELLLKAGANPNQPSGEGLNRTPIWKAIFNENFLLAQLFINYGADINHKDNTDVHISAFCIVCQSLICLEALLALKKKDGSRAIDLNETTQGRSPLAITVHSMDKERLGRAKILLQAGVDVNGHSKAYEEHPTPIWLAVRSRDLKMIQLLLDHGADVNLRNSENKTLLGHATDFMCPSVLEEILRCKPRDTNFIYRCGNSILSFLATEQILHGEIGLRAIKMMLAAGATLEAQRFLDSPNQYDLIMSSPDKNPAAIEFLEGAYLLKPGQYEKLHSSLFGQTVLHALEQRNQHPDQFLAMIDDDHLTPTEMIPTPIKQNIKNNFKKDALNKWITDFNEKLKQKKLAPESTNF
ncbi:MAG: ankyrin repeat domain-containing protein, partial [Candidatus Dependentiae bacterium]|nr:ankyrin repeat domain-containing protein [Candidatus Dependentiae bacterium]